MSLWSKVFGRGDQDKALKDAMKVIWQIIDDENYQNSMLPAPMDQLIKQGTGVDKIPGVPTRLD